ncbi:MAG: hypothetical protein KF914_19860 [Rhizobiaceae bacterium]|nr:hypothetical protein [Rhizobiaceae bacterium]
MPVIEKYRVRTVGAIGDPGAAIHAGLSANLPEVMQMMRMMNNCAGEIVSSLHKHWSCRLREARQPAPDRGLRADFA